MKVGGSILDADFPPSGRSLLHISLLAKSWQVNSGRRLLLHVGYYCLPIGTIRIMAEIDQFIDEHGDWPIK